MQDNNSEADATEEVSPIEYEKPQFVEYSVEYRLQSGKHSTDWTIYLQLAINCYEALQESDLEIMSMSLHRREVLRWGVNNLSSTPSKSLFYWALPIKALFIAPLNAGRA